MKKIFFALALAAAMLMCGLSAVAAGNEISVVLDGAPIEFDVHPAIIDGRTMVPLRAIFEAFGVTVEYDGETRVITAYPGESTITLTVDSKEMYVGDRLVTLDVPATVIDGRTLVPVRAVSEALSCDVQWDGETSTVIITSPVYEVPRPVIDFSDDADGTKKKLLSSLRYLFEQKTLPELIEGDSESLSALIINDPESFLAKVDDEAWANAMYAVIIEYMINSEENYQISSDEELFNLMLQIADKYSLHAYQNYNVDALMLYDNYCILFYLAEIDNAITIGSYAAVVSSPEGELSYFLLEQSIDGYYMLCSPTVEKHLNFGTVECDRDAFLAAVKRILGRTE